MIQSTPVEVLNIKVKYFDNKYGNVNRIAKIQQGNWIDVYAARDVEILSIDSTKREINRIIEEILFYEKVLVSGIPLCPTNGENYIKNLIDYYKEQITILEGPTLIPLGFALELPQGYEAYVVPRSSSFKHFNFIQTNSVGLIDESFKGDNDEWFYPVLGIYKDTFIEKGSKIAQFRIQKAMDNIEFDQVLLLGNEDRGGHGSTGKK